MVETLEVPPKKQNKDVFIELRKLDILSGNNIQIKDIHNIICSHDSTKLSDELSTVLMGNHKDMDVVVDLKMFNKMISQLREFK